MTPQNANPGNAGTIEYDNGNFSICLRYASRGVEMSRSHNSHNRVFVKRNVCRSWNFHALPFPGKH